MVTKYGLDYYPSSSTCEQATILEENARLKDELTKSSMAQCEHALNKIMGMQKPRNGKQGLGYVAKKKNNKKKGKSPQAKKDNIGGGNATKGKAIPRVDYPAPRGGLSGPKDDFAGITNPNYILYCDYYGDVYAKYVGPIDGYIDYSIWVPKTLVANKRGPIEKWVPKTMLPVGQNGCLIMDAQVI